MVLGAVFSRPWEAVNKMVPYQLSYIQRIVLSEVIRMLICLYMQHISSVKRMLLSRFLPC